MSILNTELKFYGSSNMQDTDSGTQGGGISTTTKVEFTQMTANSQLEAISSSSGDITQTVTVVGRDAGGVIVTLGPYTLNGATAVSIGTQVFERILKVTLSATTAGTITIRNVSSGTTWCTLEAGITTLRVPFYNAVADPTGGAAKDYYEKIFAKNTNGTLTLTNATIAEYSDPSGLIVFALETTLNGTGTSTDRLTVPASGVGTFDSATKNVVNSQNLTAGSQQGVWLRLSLAAGAAANKTTYTLRLNGSST